MIPENQPQRQEAGPLTTATVQKIERLIDAGLYAQAAELAARHRDKTTYPGLRRRYHGLFLFADSRLPRERLG